jgi:hypothetical protein
MANFYYLSLSKKKVENRIERWLDRHTFKSLKRKMHEWNTESVSDFFILQFHDELNQYEKIWATELQKEFMFEEWY